MLMYNHDMGFSFDVNKKYGKLTLKDPQNIQMKSTSKEMWICDCGREKLIQLSSVVYELTKSCGRCNEISAEEMAVRKFGKLRMKDPQKASIGSAKIVMWVCDCGREKVILMKDVVSGKAKSCGRCNDIQLEEISIKKFGRLKMKTPKTVNKWSDKKVMWVCDCGRETLIRVYSVLSGNTASCGHCYETVYNWYVKNKEKIKSLKCPFEPEDFPDGGPKPLEVIKNIDIKSKWLCSICKNAYVTKFSRIKHSGCSLTCGCAVYKISKGQLQVFNYIKTLGFEVYLEYMVNKFPYDMFIPSKNLLIEYQGTYWHSMPKSVERDKRKYETAINNGYKFLAIYDKEWLKNKDITKFKICSQLGL